MTVDIQETVGVSDVTQAAGLVCGTISAVVMLNIAARLTRRRLRYGPGKGTQD